MSEPRAQPFVLVSTAHGPLILSYLDYMRVGPQSFIGVGMTLLIRGMYEPEEVALCLEVLELQRIAKGDGVQAIDVGANIGVHTIEWSRRMATWGKVLAFEPQERVYYALAGNVALNNCFNASCLMMAVSDQDDTVESPMPDYGKPACLGSLSIAIPNNDIGQAGMGKTKVRTIPLDAFAFPRMDFIKIDVEGMEVKALEGATNILRHHRPMLLVEHVLVGVKPLAAALKAHGYNSWKCGMNLLAARHDDPSWVLVKDLAEKYAG